MHLEGGISGFLGKVPDVEPEEEDRLDYVGLGKLTYRIFRVTLKIL